MSGESGNPSRITNGPGILVIINSITVMILTFIAGAFFQTLLTVGQTGTAVVITDGTIFFLGGLLGNMVIAMVGVLFSFYAISSSGSGSKDTENTSKNRSQSSKKTTYDVFLTIQAILCVIINILLLTQVVIVGSPYAEQENLFTFDGLNVYDASNVTESLKIALEKEFDVSWTNDIDGRYTDNALILSKNFTDIISIKLDTTTSTATVFYTDENRSPMKIDHNLVLIEENGKLHINQARNQSTIAIFVALGFVIFSYIGIFGALLAWDRLKITGKDSLLETVFFNLPQSEPYISWRLWSRGLFLILAHMMWLGLAGFVIRKNSTDFEIDISSLVSFCNSLYVLLLESSGYLSEFLIVLGILFLLYFVAYRYLIRYLKG